MEEKMHSPFIYKNPVWGEKFYNREALIEEILNYTVRDGDMGNVWLFGQRQVGKTSVLKQIEHNSKTQNHKTFNGKDVKFVYFDCQGVQHKSEILNEIAYKINLDLGFPEINNPKPDFFTSIFNQIHENNFYIILLLDEFDCILTNHNIEDKVLSERILKNIRSNINGIQLLRGQPKLLGVVFTSRQFYDELTKPFTGIGSPLNYLQKEIEWFDDEGIEGLLQLYLPHESEIFGKAEISLCLKLSSGHPKIVQRCLETIYKYKTDKNPINQLEIEQEVRQFIENSELSRSRLRIPDKILQKSKKLGIKEFSISLGIISIKMRKD